MRIYISGPMTGKPDLNEPAFHEAERRLVWMGHKVFNPHHLPKTLSYRAAMEFDLGYICTEAEALVVLPGWWDSPGATAEVAAALAIEIPCYAEHAAGFYLRRGTLHQGDLDLSDKLEAVA